MNTTDTTLTALKTLADGVRLSIVRMLASQPDGHSRGCDIYKSCARIFKVSQPTMSHHLAKLVESGIVSERKEGTSKSYQLNHSYLLSLGVDVGKL